MELSFEDNDDLIKGAAVSTGKDSHLIETNLDLYPFRQGINQSIDNVSSHLSEIVASNPNKTFQIIYGGKSRTLTRILLDEVARRTDDEKVKGLIESKVRLNDEDNQMSYDKYGHAKKDISESTKVKKDFLASKIDAMADVQIFVDDYSGSGFKSENILKTFERSEFIAFAGGRHIPPDNLVDRVFIGSRTTIVWETIEKLSHQLSAHVDLRLNKRFNIWGKYISANIDSIEPQHASNLRKTNQFLEKLKSIISA